jgi:hypothetical protein
MSEKDSFRAHVLRATDQMSEELKADFERFWSIADPNGKLGQGVKEIACWAFLLGAEANRKTQSRHN